MATKHAVTDSSPTLSSHARSGTQAPPPNEERLPVGVRRERVPELTGAWVVRFSTDGKPGHLGTRYPSKEAAADAYDEAERARAMAQGRPAAVNTVKSAGEIQAAGGNNWQ